MSYTYAGRTYSDSTAKWKPEMTTLLRYVINDTDTTTREFTDERLHSLIVTSAQLTRGVVDFPREYTVDVANSGISPDPTTGDRDNGFINLIILKAACLLATGEFRSASNKGIVIRDGPSSVDARGLVSAKKQMMESTCQKYEEAELEFRLGNSNAGEAIIGPHRNAFYGGGGGYNTRGG
tara:strand:+ start:368 stop:907 length:540 start_codon:yes stop_codon:yes gene_type:complete